MLHLPGRIQVSGKVRYEVLSAGGFANVSGCTRVGALALGYEEISGLVLGIGNSRGGWEVEVCFQ